MKNVKINSAAHDALRLASIKTGTKLGDLAGEYIMAGAAKHMTTTRYFKNQSGFWRFVPGMAPEARSKFDGSWSESIFLGLEDFYESCIGNPSIVECSEEDAEP